MRAAARAALVTLIVLTAGSASAFGADFVVTKATDSNDGLCDSDCSLREAVIAANGSPGQDRVVLAAGLTYTLSLAPVDPAGAIIPGSGDLDVTDALIIDGNGSTINAGGIDRVLDIQGLFAVTLNGLTLTNGQARGFLSNGGGVFIGGGAAVTMNDSSVTSSASPFELGGPDNGGGIAVIGSFDAALGIVTRSTLSLVNSTVAANSGLSGGGIVCVLCTLTVSGSTIRDNLAFGGDGGGIAVFGDASLLSVTGSNLTGNVSSRGGGLAVPFGTSTSTLSHNRLVQNSGTGSAIFNASGIVNASNNWWGCNFGAGTGGAGCAGTPNGTSGSVTASPFLTLRIAAAPAALALGGSSTVTADLTFNSADVDTSGSGTVPNATTAAFTGTLGSFAAPTAPTTSGKAVNTLTAESAGTGNVSTTVDSQTVGTSVAIGITTNTTLTGSPASPVFVQNAVVLTAAVTSGSGAPTGTVTFKDGVTPLAGCVSVAADGSGTAICTIPANSLVAGVKSFTAEFTGTGTYFASTSSALGYTYTNAVARTPTITGAVTTINKQTTSGLVVSRNPADGPEVTHFKVTNVTGGTLFLNDGSTPVAIGAFITVAQGNAGLRFTPTPDSRETGHVTVQASVSASDAGLGGAPATADIIVMSRIITTGVDAPAGPLVRRYRGATAELIDGPTSQFNAFVASSTGGVRVADADLTWDGVPDVIAGTGPGMASRIVAFDGATGAVIRDVNVGFPGTGGVFVAAGDVDGDGFPDLVAGDGGTSTLLHVFSGASGVPLWNTTIADPSFGGGVRVAAGDVDGDGYADVIVGSGPGAGARVRVLSGATRAELRTFAPYGGFAGGVWVAAGDVNADGYSDIITGADAGGGPHVRVFDGRTGAELVGFFATIPSFTGGVRVAAGDVNGDERADVIAGLGPGGSALQVFDGVTGAPIADPTTLPAPDTGLFVSTSVPSNRMAIDQPAAGATLGPEFQLSGWAFQEGAPGTGVDAVHVWAYPTNGTAPLFLGAATLGVPRPDVGAIFGSRYAASGYHLNVTGLADGTYDVVAFAHHSASGAFNMRRLVLVRIVSPGAEVQVVVDVPVAGPVRPNMRIAGWALDLAAPGAGSGIETVHVWAHPTAGGSPMFLGAAALGDARPDVEAAFGPRGSHAGYHLDVAGLAPGDYTLGVYAKSIASPTFTGAASRTVTVTPWAPIEHLFIDSPSAGPLASGNVAIAGWALAFDAPTTPGIAAVHVWAYPVGGGAPSFLGAATLGGLRPDIAALFGAEYEATGFGLNVTGLPSGTWDLAVFPLAHGAAAFGPARIVRVTVP